MFSANENLMLRQHKRRIVDRIEKMMPEEALDMGTTVMVMQVACKAPGCVPLETAVIIVFPKSSTELIPGLPESGDSKQGGSYKTKILKPMADVEEDDILDALPPAFEGGRRTMERLCLFARDIMLAQITQLFGDDDADAKSIADREAMASYLQRCLEEYIEGGSKAPEQGEPFRSTADGDTKQSTPDMPTSDISTDEMKQQSSPSAPPAEIPAKGNIVIRRVVDEESNPMKTTTTTTTRPSDETPKHPIGATTISGRGVAPPKHQRAIGKALNPQQGSRNISRLFDRQHAPGIRQAGCPCCDPDNPSTIVDNMMMSL